MENITADPSDFRKAGAISATALRYGRDMIKVGAKLIDVLDAVEAKIHELGGEIGFPAQMSFGEIAAHDCADPNDQRTIPKSLIKIDVGVAVNGCVGDNAWTVDLTGKYGELCKASQEALRAAIETAKVGVEIGKVGKAIQETIEGYGYLPVHNLSGHGLSPYKVHCPPTMPNYNNKNPNKLQKGMVIAIEPFATDGEGEVYELERGNVFMMGPKRPVRSQTARELLKIIEGYKGLPFTTRWLTKLHPVAKVNLGLRELLMAGIIRAYPPLK